MYYIGIDLGTSSVKGILVTPAGEIMREASEEYPVSYPRDGWSEQKPEDWLCAVKKMMKELAAGIETEVGGISFGGQMHGLVALDGEGNVIRPCILWNDGRTQKQTDYLNEKIGRERLSAMTANIAYAGFTAPKILWLKENEPENFAKIKKIMLPKDYLVYKLTGKFSSDYSDASGTLLLDVKNKRWSKEMLEICSVKEEWLPPLYESYEAVGKVLPEYGLPNAIVAAGAGDNAAAAIGMGVVKNGDCNLSVGTSGTVFIVRDEFSADENNALHAFAHANGKWHFMGCILSAASANKWWIEEILKTKAYEDEVAPASDCLGENGVFFLPYLMGERSPHNDVNARGAFIGMRPDTTRAEMGLAVLEGVAFALRDCVEVARKSGVSVTRSCLCGGGAKSPLWEKILANVLDVEIVRTATEQGPSYGAALLAMVAGGEYSSVAAATEKTVSYRSRLAPEKELVKKYNRKYEIYQTLYPSLKASFALMK